MLKKGVFILGSTGKTGMLLTTGLLPDREVVAMHRNNDRRPEFEDLGARVIVADAIDRESVFTAARDAAATCDTAISFLGGTPFSDPEAWPDYTGNVNAIDASRAAGIRRFILVTSIGTGDSANWVPENSAFLLPLLELKTRAEAYLRGADIDWTILKPGGLVNAEDYPEYRPPLVTTNPAVRGVITRNQLADVALRLIVDPDGRTSRQELHTVAYKIQVYEGEAVPLIEG